MSDYSIKAVGAEVFMKQASDVAKAGLIHVGDVVIVTDDNGKESERIVRMEPWKLGSGHWVVALKGIAGGYSLDRVRLKGKS